jgi:hypothetical protein
MSEPEERRQKHSEHVHLHDNGRSREAVMVLRHGKRHCGHGEDHYTATGCRCEDCNGEGWLTHDDEERTWLALADLRLRLRHRYAKSQ